jgi:hypothetical protein
MCDDLYFLCSVWSFLGKKFTAYSGRTLSRFYAVYVCSHFSSDLCATFVANCGTTLTLHNCQLPRLLGHPLYLLDK